MKYHHLVVLQNGTGGRLGYVSQLERRSARTTITGFGVSKQKRFALNFNDVDIAAQIAVRLEDRFGLSIAITNLD